MIKINILGAISCAAGATLIGTTAGGAMGGILGALFGGTIGLLSNP